MPLTFNRQTEQRFSDKNQSGSFATTPVVLVAPLRCAHPLNSQIFPRQDQKLRWVGCGRPPFDDYFSFSLVLFKRISDKHTHTHAGLGRTLFLLWDSKWGYFTNHPLTTFFTHIYMVMGRAGLSVHVDCVPQCASKTAAAFHFCPHS